MRMPSRKARRLVTNLALGGMQAKEEGMESLLSAKLEILLYLAELESAAAAKGESKLSFPPGARTAKP